MISFISWLIPFGALLLLIALIIFFIVFLASFLFPIIHKHKIKPYAFLNKYRVEIIFLLSFGSTIGSLFYSEVLLLPPCSLCWYGRICMYGIALLSATALWKEKTDTRDFVMPFAVAGAIISLYHMAVQAKLIGSFFCSTESAVSCATAQFTAYGFLTLPMMGLIIYTTIILLLLKK